MSRAYVVTDAYIITAATHVEKLVKSRHKNPFQSLADLKDLIEEQSDFLAV